MKIAGFFHTAKSLSKISTQTRFFLQKIRFFSGYQETCSKISHLTLYFE